MKNSGFYELRLLEAKVAGEPVYFVRETHGQWDDHKKRVVYDKDSLLPVEGFRNHGEAEERFCQERLPLAKRDLYTRWFGILSPKGIPSTC